jgi:hypothetical protein
MHIIPPYYYPLPPKYVNRWYRQMISVSILGMVYLLVLHRNPILCLELYLRLVPDYAVDDVCSAT